MLNIFGEFPELVFSMPELVFEIAGNIS